MRSPIPSRDRSGKASRAGSRFIGFTVPLIVLMGVTTGAALGVVGGRTVSITAAPWTVLVREYGQPRCTGVIISSVQILTAGHCVMVGDSAKPLSASVLRIEAGVSNFKHPLKSDHPQFRAVSAVRVIPGYIPTSRQNNVNATRAVGHDVAVLTLSRPLNLTGVDARAARVPSANLGEPSAKTRLLTSGFGDESQGSGADYLNGTSNGTSNGTLNAVGKSSVERFFSTTSDLFVFQSSLTSFGDSGSGLIEPGKHPTVVGILSTSEPGFPGRLRYISQYVALTAPAILRFIKTSQ